MLSFASATGNLFNRLGKLANLIKVVQSYQQTQLPAMTDTTNGVVAQYNSESDLQAMMGNSYISSLSGPESVCSTAQQLAQATFNRMIFRDNPQLNQTLQQSNLLSSIQQVILQMNVAGATVLAMPVSSANNAFIGTGNGSINSSVKRAIDGRTMENSFTELVTLTCINDSYSGGAQAGNERFHVTGQGQQTDLFAFNWPLGSNGNISLSAINGDANNSQGNILTNSGFASWTTTANVPNNFLLTTGTAGTDIFQENTIVYSGASSLKIVGGNTVVLTQQFANNAGTVATLSPQTQYSVNFFIRSGAAIPGAGTLAIALVDQNNNIISDVASVQNTFSTAMTGLSTVFTAYKGVFRTPIIMPSSVYLRITVTGLSGGTAIYLGKLSMGLTSQLYTSGPSFAVHSGSTPFVRSTYGTSQVTNSRGAANTLNTFQTALARLLDPLIYQNGILFPSSSIPSISDSLIG